MKSEESIKERINKLEKRIKIVAKHHDKYIDLRRKAANSWKDVFTFRASKYLGKRKKLYEKWQQMTYYKKGLEWTLKAESEQQ